MSRVIKAGHLVTSMRAVPVVAAVEPPELTPPPVRSIDGGRVAAVAQERAALFNQVKREARQLLLHSHRVVGQRLAELAAKEDSIEQELENARRAGRQEGYDDGYRDGFKKGRHEALHELSELIEAARATLEEARRSQWRLQERAEDDIVKLAVAVAEKLTSHALRTDDSVILSILKSMLAKVEGSATAHVRLPREIHTRLYEECQSLAASMAGACTLQFLPDDGLQAGDVVIETDWGLIDGRVQSRWQRIIQGLDLLEHEADDTD